MEETLLHAVVCANVLEDIPGEFLIQLPGAKGHADGGESNNGRNGDEKGLDVAPEFMRGDVVAESIGAAKNGNSRLNLVDLDGGIDEHGQVGDADANDLNRVFHAEGIPDDDQLVEETKNEESEKGGNGEIL